MNKNAAQQGSAHSLMRYVQDTMQARNYQEYFSRIFDAELPAAAYNRNADFMTNYRTLVRSANKVHFMIDVGSKSVSLTNMLHQIGRQLYSTPVIFGTALDGYERTYDNNGNLTMLFLDACHVLKTSLENLFWHKQSFNLRLNNGIIDDSRGAM